MPIYEYQCRKCRRVLNFLVRSVTAHSAPVCPKCGHPEMERVLSRFAAPKRRVEAAAPSGGNTSPDPGMDRMMAEADGIDENDPRAMGRFMRTMAEETGEPVPDEMNEVIRRLESGEDPESIEEQMGDLLGEDPGGPRGGDTTLYDA